MNWNLLQYTSLIVSQDYSRPWIDIESKEEIKLSFFEQMSDSKDKNLVWFDLLTIYAGMIGIALEGN